MKGHKIGNMYPIRAAARLTQLSIDTLRAWEKRYAAVRPIRKNGIRLYTEGDIERLSLLRQAVEHGHSIGQVSGLTDTALKSLAQPRAERPGTDAAERPIETIMALIERFQYAAADRELRHLASLMTPRDLIHRVALPLLRMVGEQWHDQRLRVAQEHMITQMLSNLLGGMTRIYAPERPPATVLTATLSDDLHGFGILAASILAVGAGLEVIHLGPNLPVKEIVYAAKRSGAEVVLLSLTNPHDRTLREEQLQGVRSGLPGSIELWIAINPAGANINVKGGKLLTSFEDLERELRRIGGRF